jgi:hypothetical protein
MRHRAYDPPQASRPVFPKTTSSPYRCLPSMVRVRILTSSIAWQFLLSLVARCSPYRDDSPHLAQCFPYEEHDAAQDSCGIRIAISLFLSPSD